MIRLRSSAPLLVLPFLFGACTVSTSSTDTRHDEAGVVDDAGAQQEAGGNDTGGSSDAATDVPDPELLAIPATDGTVRVVVEGGGWSGYDRSCTGVASADSYHSVGFERAYVQMTDACAATHGANAVFQIARAGGLVPGVHGVAKDGSTIGQLALTPADHPHVESQLDGKLWIRTADTVGDETLLEVSYYGTTRWRSSTTDETEADVKVKVSFRARLRTTDVP